MKKFLVFLLVVSLFVGACSAPSATPITNEQIAAGTPIPDKVCVLPESDNDYHWYSNTCVQISTKVYTVKIQVNDTIVNKVENNSSASYTAIDGFATGSYRSWQDGKGSLPVIILSISDSFPGVYNGANGILKTVDSKAMALPNGAITEFICNQDIEVLSPSQNYQTMTEDRQTYELDDCRMKYLTYTMPPEE